jgi:hypothetical protein
MAASTKHPPKPRATIEVEADWLERPRDGSAGHRRPAVPPPLPPEDAPVSVRSAGAPAAPPPLAANSARHNTMPVETQWLEVTELDAKLRASLAPLPPPDEKTRARMSTPIPREDPDDEPGAATPAIEETKPRRKRAVKKPSSKR